MNEYTFSKFLLLLDLPRLVLLGCTIISLMITSLRTTLLAGDEPAIRITFEINSAEDEEGNR